MQRHLTRPTAASDPATSWAKRDEEAAEGGVGHRRKERATPAVLDEDEILERLPRFRHCEGGRLCGRVRRQAGSAPADVEGAWEGGAAQVAQNCKMVPKRFP